MLRLLDYGKPAPYGATNGRPRHLAWPLHAYRVTLPRVLDVGNGLNAFERVILKLLDAAGRMDADALAAQREMRSATVSSLRLDAVLAAMLRCSRGMASELIAAGRVEINHLPADKPHAPVYEGDVFTVRGKGRFGLTALPGKSKKDRQIIEFFQY